MNDDWRIRQFEKDDLATVVAINKMCLPENYPEQFFMGLHYHAPKAFLVAVKENYVVGYIMCRIERGISSFGRLPVKKGHIVSIAVSPDARKMGIGSALVESAMDKMHEYGASEFFLEVRKSNEEAISIYENLEYDLKRVLKGYYRDGEDAYLMVKQHEPTEDEETDE